MFGATRKLAAATAALLVAGLLVTGTSGSANAADEFCPGMNAPQNTRTLNQAPTLANDTARVLVGNVVAIKVLANDSDPDGDKLYVTSTSSPARGETCIGKTGVIEFYPYFSTTNYTTTFTYGVTDGDRYRSAKVTVNVEGVKPVLAKLRHKLTYKKHTRTVKHGARITFTNTNRRGVFLLAGNPRKKSFPSIQRVIRAGGTTAVRTRTKRFAYVIAMRDADGFPIFINFGMLNTKTGRHRIGIPEEDDFRKTPAGLPAWVRSTSDDITSFRGQ